LIGARRIFRKSIVTPSGKELPVHVHGGTVIDKDHRGRGYYSELLEQSMEYSENEVDYVITFNREGKITTKHHKKEGWNWVTLPIYTKIISPSKLLSHQYLDNELSKFGSELAKPVEKRLTRLDLVSRAITKAASLKFGESAGSSSRRKISNEKGIEIASKNGDEISEEELREMVELLEEDIEGNHHYQRNISILNHCVKYPESRVFTARRKDDELVGFAVCGILEKAGLRECRILEQNWMDEKVGEQVLKEVENDSRDRDVDVIAVASDKFPEDPTWLKIDTEYMMWEELSDGKKLSKSSESWKLSIYDVL